MSIEAAAATSRMPLRRGLALEYLTLAWNVAGTVLLMVAAVGTGSDALAGFAVDSLIEIVASSVVVWQLKGEKSSGRERRALRTIAIAFVLLAIYIAAQGLITLTAQLSPRALDRGDRVAGAHGDHNVRARCRETRDGASPRECVLLTEARVTVINGALAAAVLLGVALNAAVGWWWADPLSAVVILVYAVREARHAWGEAR